MAWEYKREERKFEVLPEGKYRVRIKEADKAISKKGNDMLVIQLNVSGSAKVLYHYIVFMDDRPEITNQKLTEFFDSFKDIPEGDFNMANWIGKVGACVIKHEEYNGEQRERISYFIRADKQGDLPPWKEVSGNAPKLNIPKTDEFISTEGMDLDVPFE